MTRIATLAGVALVGLGWLDMATTPPLEIPFTLPLVAAGVACLCWAWDRAERTNA